MYICMREGRTEEEINALLFAEAGLLRPRHRLSRMNCSMN